MFVNNLTPRGLNLYLVDADESPTECDGCSRLVSHKLTLIGQPHALYQGEATLSLISKEDITLSCTKNNQEMSSIIESLIRQYLGSGSG